MRNVLLSLPSFAFVVVTRAALAAGIGLLVSNKLPAGRRRAIGATLIGIGAATTIPAVINVMRGVRVATRPGVDYDRRLIGATRFPRKGDDEFE